MTPKQRDLMAGLQRQVRFLEGYYRFLKWQFGVLRAQFEDSPTRESHDFNETPHCWLFHDLYDHSYGLEQPTLSLQDCLRMGRI